MLQELQLTVLRCVKIYSCSCEDISEEAVKLRAVNCIFNLAQLKDKTAEFFRTKFTQRKILNYH